jgi:hypothetical protein
MTEEVSTALAMLERLSGQSTGSCIPSSCFARIHLCLGVADLACTWMDRAIETRDPMIIPIKTYPFLDAFRGDGRYRALLSKMNLGLSRGS